MNLTTKQIAEEINGTLEGDSEIQISQLSKIEEGMKGSISFLANPKYTDYIYSTKASAVVVSNDFNPSEKISTTLIRVKDPYQSFTDLLELYNSNQNNYTSTITFYYLILYNIIFYYIITYSILVYSILFYYNLLHTIQL